MRPASLAFNNLLVSHVAVGHGLLALSNLRYDRQIVPDIDHTAMGQLTPITGKANVDQERPQSEPQSPKSPASREETRAERLARIKAEIEAGEYETEEKLEKAIDRMLGVLLED